MRDPDEEYIQDGVSPLYLFRDLTLKEEVAEALAFHEDLDASQVEVDARSGVITLYGTVQSESEKESAADCASDIEGVITVINLISLPH